MLDIDPRGRPDIVCDSRNLSTLPPSQFDAIYCSHNLEHYYQHDGVKVLRGFLHILKPDGFTMISVPDLRSVMQHLVKHGMDIGDVLYVSPNGPITFRDVIYGWGKEIETSGKDFYAHKTGFTSKLLERTLAFAGFGEIAVWEMPDLFEVRAVAFKTVSTAVQRALLNLQSTATPSGK